MIASTLSAGVRRLRALAGRHPAKVWLVWALGAVVLLATPLALADPAMWLLVLDPELLAIVAAAGLALFRASTLGFLARFAAASAGLGRTGPRRRATGATCAARSSRAPAGSCSRTRPSGSSPVRSAMSRPEAGP